MSLQNVLKYQEEDKKLFSLDAKLAQSEANKKFKFYSNDKAKAQDEIKMSVRKLDELYNLVENHARDINNANEELADIIATAGHFEELREVDLYEKKLMQLQKSIEQIDREVNRINKDITEINTTSRAAIMKLKSCNSEIEKAKIEFDKVKAEQQAERLEIIKTLKPLEETLSPELLTKYQEIRKRGKLPIVVKLNGRSCTGCCMDVDQYILDKLGDGIAECPNCGRMIYREQN